jgi:hypothetical protein
MQPKSHAPSKIWSSSSWKLTTIFVLQVDEEEKEHVKIKIERAFSVLRSTHGTRMM